MSIRVNHNQRASTGKELPGALFWADRLCAFGQTAIKWGFGAYVAVSFFGEMSRSIGHLAGQETSARLALSYFVNCPSGITVTVSLGFSLACLGYGLFERRLRHRTLAQSGGYQAELERRLDPRRTSSGLTSDGRTHPRDR
jgi:hypothetical protein